MPTTLENILITCYKKDMIRYLIEHPADYEEALQLALTDKPVFSKRAAWLIWSCTEKNDPRLMPHRERLLEALADKPGNHQRELLKLFQLLDLEEEQEGRLYQHCLTLWENLPEQPSVRNMAFTLMLKTARRFPELIQEILLLTQPHYLDNLSPGIKRSIEKQRKMIRKQFPEYI